MTCKIDLDSELQIVHVIYTGEVSLEERVQAVKEVCQTYSHLTPLRIIVNVCEIKVGMSVHEQKQFGNFLASHPGLTGAKVAVLHEHTHNPNLLIDSVAFNNGYTLAEFNNTKDAEQWLVPT